MRFQCVCLKCDPRDGKPEETDGRRCVKRRWAFQARVDGRAHSERKHGGRGNWEVLEVDG